MPKLNSRGDVAHGIGGGRVNLNNAVVYPTGGVGGWIDDDTIGFVGGDQWLVSKFHVPTSRAETIRFNEQERVANNLRAGGGHVTAWGPGGMFSTRDGLTLPNAGLIDMGYDGALIYKPAYHSHGPTMVREIDGSEWQITAGHTDYVHHVGQRRAVHLEGGRVFAHNLPQPVYTNAGGIWKTEIAFAGGEWWISYYSGAHGVVLHPFNSLVGFSVLAKGDGWHTIREIDARTIRVAISVGEGEQAGQIWVRDYDVVANRVRDPWGANVWAAVPRVEIPTINAPVAPVDPPVDPPKPPIEPPKPGDTTMTYRDYSAHFARRWHELGIPEKTRQAVERGETDEEALKRIHVPALVQIVGELHHREGRRDVGLSTKNTGNRFTLPDGRNIANDIVTIKPTDDAGNVVEGNFVLVDAIRSVGSAESSPTWQVLGPNTDPSRPWMKPPVPEGRPTPVDPVEPDPVEPDPVDPGVPANGDVIALLQEIRDSNLRQEQKLDELRTGVIEAVRQFGGEMKDLFPSFFRRGEGT